MTDEIPDGYTRVTEILQPYTNFSMILPAVLANAADRGTRVHKFCELINCGLFVGDIDSDCVPYVDSYERWFDANVDTVLYTEQRINSEDLKLTGQIDAIAKLKNGELAIIDIKTPALPSKSWALQTAAYAHLVSSELQLHGCKRICVMAKKTGGKARIMTYDEDHDLTLYLNALELYKYFGERPINLEEPADPLFDFSEYI